jgi:hypothetical protein
MEQAYQRPRRDRERNEKSANARSGCESAENEAGKRRVISSGRWNDGDAPFSVGERAQRDRRTGILSKSAL